MIRSSLLILVAMFSLVAIGKPAAQTKTLAPSKAPGNANQCNNIVALAGNVNVNCTNLTAEQRDAIEKIPTILSKILKNQLPAEEVLKKLDEIQKAISEGKIVQHCAPGTVCMTSTGSGTQVSTGPCSNVQIGGSNNNAQANCPPTARHLTADQKRSIAISLEGKHLKVRFNALMNVPDSQQFAFELCSAFHDGGASTDCRNISFLYEGAGHPWSGLKIVFRGDADDVDGHELSISLDSPPGIVLRALMSAGLNQAVGHTDPAMAADEADVTVGLPPTNPSPFF